MTMRDDKALQIIEMVQSGITCRRAIAQVTGLSLHSIAKRLRNYGLDLPRLPPSGGGGRPAKKPKPVQPAWGGSMRGTAKFDGETDYSKAKVTIWQPRPDPRDDMQLVGEPTSFADEWKRLRQTGTAHLRSEINERTAGRWSEHVVRSGA